jgi:pimeloyl-ACP methyl ester carboxylesterase
MSGRGIVPAEIGNRFDLVSWDPRGVSRTAPVECLSDAEMDDWAATPGISSRPTATDWQGALNDAQWFADKCRAGTGEMLAYIGTTASARDMESIRVGLGVEKLDYLGFSYGTALGAVYATLFPTSTGHLILDGAVDMEPTDESEYGEQGVSIQGALDRLFAWCDADAACPFGGGETRAAFDVLMENLDDRPIPLGGGRSLNSSLAWTGVVLTLYNRDYWDLAVQGLAKASEGNGALLSELADAYLDRAEDGSYRSNIMEAFPAISCIDSPTTPSIARYQAIYEKFVSKAPDFAAGQASGGLLCGVWPYKSADPLPTVVNGAGAAPILVVGTTGDPATPYAWSERMADLLESGHLLTFVGEGHTAVGGKSACIDDAAITFLVSGTLPPEGTRCND